MVTLFSTGCPKCRVLEAKLKAANIPFRVISDIDVIVAYGFLSLPVLMTDGTRQTFDFNQAMRWIADQTGESFTATDDTKCETC